MRVGGPARYLVTVESPADASSAFAFAHAHNLPVFILGGGSNVIFSDAGYSGVVIQPKMLQKTIVLENEDTVLVKVGAGEVWDEVVADMASRGFWGIENLSHIPGLTGAVVIQNVGAYGQEASQVVHEVELLEIKTGAVRKFDALQCCFGYRTSIFNTTEKGRYLVLSITFRLTKNGSANLSYRDVQTHFTGRKAEELGLADMREAVIAIRSAKLPDWKVVGTAGSFFKNMLIPEPQLVDVERAVFLVGGEVALGTLRQIIKSENSKVKIPTAYLIELLGLKGYRYGGASISTKHALVIENAGEATTSDILTLASMVCDALYTTFGLVVELEPEIVN